MAVVIDDEHKNVILVSFTAGTGRSWDRCIS